MIYTIDAEALAKAYISGANKLCNHKNILNELNVYPVPDGDTGNNMSMTVSAATRELLGADFKTVEDVFSIIANASLRGARGNSGVILSQLFRGIAKRLKGCKIADATDISEALTEGVHAAYRAVMKPAEGTILSVSRDAAAAGQAVLEESNDLVTLLRTVVSAGQVSLDKTPELLPQLKQAGVVDSGGQGVMYILEGALAYLETGELIELTEGEISAAKTLEKKEVAADIKYSYCTEFLIEKNNSKVSSKLFRDKIEKKGDCMVVIDDGEIIKVHIHSNNPGFVIEEALKLGELINIKIDNMKHQHNSIITTRQEPEPELEPPKKYGFAAVAVGSGIEAIFRDMGVDAIIEGGQTMNPSTDDILEAVKNINAEHIIILPNNKNIIMAAEHAKDLTEKDLIVIPTRSIPEGISAKLAFDPAKEPEDNASAMEETLQYVKTGTVTYSVRNFTFEDKEVEKGKILGMQSGKICTIGEKPSAVCKRLLEKMTDEDSEIITVFYGSDVKEEVAKNLEEYLEKTYPACDIVVHHGGQPLYYYIVSVE